MSDSTKRIGVEPATDHAAAALAALRRAAIKARRETLALSGSVLIRKNGELVYESDPAVLFPDSMGDEPTPNPGSLPTRSLP